MNRKEFLKSIIGASAFLAFPFSSFDDPATLLRVIEDSKRSVKGNMVGFKSESISKVRVGLLGSGNRGQMLIEMFPWLVENGYAEIVAISDLEEGRVNKTLEKIKAFQAKTPAAYWGNPNEWKKLVQRDDIDLLIIATPWELHTPMAIEGMERGKHVALEVPVAYTLSECWELIETAERTQKHCIMLENCCYNDEELFVLNMVENGVFGDLTHAEGAYLHDLRGFMLHSGYYQDYWRLKHHTYRDGNFYTTHGLGPVSFYMHIGRGDTYAHLTSMSSREMNLTLAAEKANVPYKEFKCGDMNTTLIKTEKGKTIMLQFDVHTGRPYSRINKVVGTKAVHDGYPSRLYIEPEELSFSHHWLDEESYNDYKSKYEHPMITRLKSISENFKQGHGGMDFVMIYRLIRCLNLGIALDINLYDSVMWSAVTPLSEISVASKSLSIPFPDFTGGTWKNKSELEIMREIGTKVHIE